jgi:hypothetical protein
MKIKQNKYIKKISKKKEQQQKKQQTNKQTNNGYSCAYIR